MTDDLSGVDPGRLTRVVRRAVGDPEAAVGAWSYERLSWAAINPSTVALYRVFGTAQTGSGQDEVPWVVVLKIVGDVDFTDHPLDQDYMHNPQDWNYWRREALVFESGLLDEWSGPIRPVRTLGVEHVDDSHAWIWLEAVEGARPRTPWTRLEFVEAAYHLGGLAARWAPEHLSRADHPWLAERWSRGWLRSIRAIGLDHALEHDGCWAHPLLAGIVPEGSQSRLRSLMADADRLLDVLESLPVTLAHHDPQQSNMFRTAVDETTVIDWGFCGLAAVGVDLGLFVAGNLNNWAVDPSQAKEHDDAATTAYLRGLADFGWKGDEASVLFARAAAGALVVGSWCGLQASVLCEHEGPDLGDDASKWPYDLAAKQQISLEAAMTGWAAAFTYILDLGDAARTLGRRLAGDR